MAGQGQVPSRQAAVKAGIPMSVPSVNVNKVCLSGLNTIYLADQMIAAGEADIVVAGGMESMTNAPYLADGARAGFRYGNTELRDAIIADGLWCAFDACLMGLGTERYAAGIDQPRGAGRARRGVARAGRQRDQGRPLRRRDRPGRRSPSARASRSSSRRRGRPPGHDAGEPRRPAAGVRQGRHGHRRQRLADQRRRQRRRADVEGGGRARAASSRSASSCPTAWSPGPTRRRCCSSRATPSARPSQRGGLEQSALDLYEINEAFAAVGLASMADLGISERRRQRQRRRDRPRPPDRHERQPPRPDAAPRAAPARRRHRRGRALRRWRPGRRADRAHALTPPTRASDAGRTSFAVFGHRRDFFTGSMFGHRRKCGRTDPVGCDRAVLDSFRCLPVT